MSNDGRLAIRVSPKPVPSRGAWDVWGIVAGNSSYRSTANHYQLPISHYPLLPAAH